MRRSRTRGTRASVTGLERADAALVELVDAAVRAGEASAGARLACRLGCTACCVGVFDVTLLDAARLQRGLDALRRERPECAARVVARAREQAVLLAPTFPGDAASGSLDDDEAARQAFFARHAALPCPVLDPASGACELYASRPLTCRSYGLPARYGEVLVPHCELNLVGADAAELEHATIEPDPLDREGELLAWLRREQEDAGDTVIAFALADLAGA